MKRPTKRTLILAGGAVGLLALAAVAAPRLVDVDRLKPRLEAAATGAIGMDVRIGGRLDLGWFPCPHVSFDDSRILDARGVAVVSVKRTRLWIAPLPLLRGAFRLDRVELTRPALTIELGEDGRCGLDRLRNAAALLVALDGARISVSEGSLVHVDRRSGRRFDVAGLDLAVRHVRFAGGRAPPSLASVSLDAEAGCRELRTNGLSASAVKASIHAKDGILRLEPITLRVFGGQATASLRADVSSPVPRFQVHCALSRFAVAEALRALSPNQVLDGTMDFSAILSMQGTTRREMVRSLAGAVSLRGADLVLQGGDLDRRLSRFESSQNFNLVDVGAVFFAGPLGLAVTRGYSFASLFRGSGGSSRIRALVSDWRIERGVAEARDVALATAKNRIALQGRLDLGGERFEDTVMAVVDAHGCATVRQAIRGSFADPEVEKPRVLVSIAGPVFKLYSRTRKLFPQGPCEAFYSGSVAPPG